MYVCVMPLNNRDHSVFLHSRFCVFILQVYISMFFHAFIAKQQQQQEQQAKSATTAQLQDDNSDSLSQNDSANNNNVSDRKESETALREQLQAANQTIAELKEKNQVCC